MSHDNLAEKTAAGQQKNGVSLLEKEDIENIVPQESEELQSEKKLFYIITGSADLRINRKIAGSKKEAMWWPDMTCWVFSNERRPKKICEHWNKNRKDGDPVLEIRKLPCPRAEKYFNGTCDERKRASLQNRIDYLEYEIYEEDRDLHAELDGEHVDDLQDEDPRKKQHKTLLEKKKEQDELRRELENEEDDFDDEEEEESTSSQEKDKANARLNARRRAIKGEAEADISRELKKQYRSLKKDCKEIAKKAVEWAKEREPGQQVEVAGISKTVTDLKSINERFAQLEAKGQPCVTIYKGDAQPISDKDFNKRLSGEVVLTGVKADGQPNYTAASAFWTGSNSKHIYKKIAFTSEKVEGDAYNLFNGFGVKPEEGCCEKIQQHIHEVICASKEVEYEAFLNLLAWQVQNIGKPSRVVTVLKSEEHQVGKGVLLEHVLKPIYGRAGLITSDMNQITGRFNDTLRGVSYLFLDEALFAGDKKAADRVKSLATTTQMNIETKGLPIITLPSALNLFLATNHEDAAHVEEADARYWILEVSPCRKRDFAYFNELFSEINRGGLEAFLHYLLSRDISSFIPQRDVPKDNEAKNAMIKNSINPYDARKWLEECCEAEMIIGMKPFGEPPEDMEEEERKVYYQGWQPWIAGKKFTNGALHSAYQQWVKDKRPVVRGKETSSNEFGKILIANKFEIARFGDRYGKTLPEIRECLEGLFTPQNNK